MAADKSNAKAMVCQLCRRKFDPGMQVCPDDGCALSPAASDPLVGTIFAEKYEIIERIGKGGMGVVYKARHTFMENFVAVKILYDEYATNQASLDRFKQEAKTLAALKHPNILAVTDFGITPDKQPFLIMEYLEGTSIGDFLEKEIRMPLSRALNLFLQACDGLEHAHSKGVIHRDLKPGNLEIITDEDDRESVKILDFGIAKMKPREGRQEQHLTQSGEIYGSPLYMSPEQCAAKPLDERSDIYSFGCVMYETLTGMPPLMGLNSFETMTKHMQERPRSLRRIAPDLQIPEAFDLVILKTLKKDPNKRPQSATALKRDLLEAAAQSDLYAPAHVSGLLHATSFTTKTGSNVTVVASDGAEQIAQDLEPSELQLMVERARTASKRHAQAASHMKRLSIFLGAAFTGFVVCAGAYLTLPGPPEDPAPNWQKQLWRIDMEAADKFAGIWIKENKHHNVDADFENAVSRYRRAISVGKSMGPMYDKELKAQLNLLALYKERGPAGAVQAEQTREHVITDHLNRMVTLYGSDASTRKIISELDRTLMSERQFNPNELDPQFTDAYVRKIIDNARESFTQKRYWSTIGYLQEALTLEQRARGRHKGLLVATVSQLAKEMNQSAATDEQKLEMSELLERAWVIDAPKN